MQPKMSVPARIIFLLHLLWCAQVNYGYSELLVIGLRGHIDDASNRCKRSAEVFGYDYQEEDFSTFGRTLGDVADQLVLQRFRNLFDNTTHLQGIEHVLFIDSHASLLLARPNELLKAAGTLKSDFLFLSDRDAKKRSIFRGLLAKPDAIKIMLAGAYTINQFWDNLSQLESVYKEDVDSHIFQLISKSSDIAFTITAKYCTWERELSSLSRLQGEAESAHVCCLFADALAARRTQINENTYCWSCYRVLKLFAMHLLQDDAKIRYEDDRGYLQNIRKYTIPPVAVSAVDENSKMRFNSMANYLAKAWAPETGCRQCDEMLIDLSSRPKSEYPVVMLSIFVSEPTPFLEKFFGRIANLTYPKSRMHLTVHSLDIRQDKYYVAFVSQYGLQYRSVKIIDAGQYSRTRSAFDFASAACMKITECDFLFYVDAIAHFTESKALEVLVSANRSIIAPVMSRRNNFWSTFWGAMKETGGYDRSDDYFDIIQRRKIGVWHVPLVGSTFLMSRWAIKEITSALPGNNIYKAISQAAVVRNVFEYATNRVVFGYLINPKFTDLSHRHGDLWQIFANQQDWEDEYVHPDYHKWANRSTPLEAFEQPCNEVYWVPLMTERFCKQFIEEMEHFGQWSDGTTNDGRLESGYEPVPTRDIHVRQINWESHWLYFLRVYVHPIQLNLFEMYYDSPTARMNFVVRYRPDEQASLRKHFDAATYTLDMALNRAHIDYQGGGVRFNRQNCSLVDTRVGWTLIFPGRPTHLHEGLETTNGTRYIFVTFVNP